MICIDPDRDNFSAVERMWEKLDDARNIGDLVTFLTKDAGR